MKRDKDIVNAALYGFMAGVAFSGVLRAILLYVNGKKRFATNTHSEETCCGGCDGCHCDEFDDWEEEED